jgi:hypothetical protein
LRCQEHHPHLPSPATWGTNVINKDQHGRAPREHRNLSIPTCTGRQDPEWLPYSGGEGCHGVRRPRCVPVAAHRLCNVMRFRIADTTLCRTDPYKESSRQVRSVTSSNLGAQPRGNERSVSLSDALKPVPFARSQMAGLGPVARACGMMESPDNAQSISRRAHKGIRGDDYQRWKGVLAGPLGRISGVLRCDLRGSR